MKKSPYLCKTKNKWRVRLVVQDDWLFGQKTEVRILYTLQNMARSSTGLARETDGQLNDSKVG